MGACGSCDRMCGVCMVGTCERGRTEVSDGLSKLGPLLTDSALTRLKKTTTRAVVFDIAARAPLAVEHPLVNAASAVEVDGGARERIPEAAFDDERSLLSIVH